MYNFKVNNDYPNKYDSDKDNFYFYKPNKKNKYSISDRYLFENKDLFMAIGFNRMNVARNKNHINKICDSSYNIEPITNNGALRNHNQSNYKCLVAFKKGFLKNRFKHNGYWNEDLLYKNLQDTIEGSNWVLSEGGPKQYISDNFLKANNDYEVINFSSPNVKELLSFLQILAKYAPKIKGVINDLSNRVKKQNTKERVSTFMFNSISDPKNKFSDLSFNFKESSKKSVKNNKM